MSLNIRTIADLNLAIIKNLHRLDRNSFDIVVGIPRSGMIPASIICTSLQKPLSDVEGFSSGRSYERYNIKALGRRILLVDDSVNKGRAMSWAVQKLQKQATSIQRLGVYGPYQLPNPKEVCDIWFEDCKGPRVFQWNMWKHIRLERWAFDFDGVFCRDPTKEDNDDGPRYMKFLTTAEPLFIPKRGIGHIITGRLEKYRAPTIDWLKNHGIVYKELHMMPYATKAERMAAGGRGQWKADILKGLDVELFVESDPKQASIISNRTGLQVWCTSTQTVFDVMKKDQADASHIPDNAIL